MQLWGGNFNTLFTAGLEKWRDYFLASQSQWEPLEEDPGISGSCALPPWVGFLSSYTMQCCRQQELRVPGEPRLMFRREAGISECFSLRARCSSPCWAYRSSCVMQGTLYGPPRQLPVQGVKQFRSLGCWWSGMWKVPLWWCLHLESSHRARSNCTGLGKELSGLITRLGVRVCISPAWGCLEPGQQRQGLEARCFLPCSAPSRSPNTFRLSGADGAGEMIQGEGSSSRVSVAIASNCVHAVL